MVRTGPVLLVVGTRPDVIKTAPVLRALRTSRIRTLLLATAQHRELMDSMLRLFGLRPDFDLDVMRPRQTPWQVLRRVAGALPAVLEKARPSLIVVQGDTSSALAAALAGRYARIPVAHIEAGLRSHDLEQPFPEELNRVLIDRLASLHFAPTADNRRNLLREGISAQGILVTGNTVVDALRWVRAQGYPWSDLRLEGFLARGRGPRGGAPGPLAMLTCHRRESFGRPMGRIFAAARRLLELRPDLRLVHPLHPNPAVRAQALSELRHPRALHCAPLAYPDFVRLLAASDLVLSDSGGVQEEAPSLGKRVIVLREVTDRPEAVRTGWATLVGTRTAEIVREAQRQLRRDRRSRPRDNPFASRGASERVAARIQAWLRSRFLRS